MNHTKGKMLDRFISKKVNKVLIWVTIAQGVIYSVMIKVFHLENEVLLNTLFAFLGMLPLSIGLYKFAFEIKWEKTTLSKMLFFSLNLWNVVLGVFFIIELFSLN